MYVFAIVTITATTTTKRLEGQKLDEKETQSSLETSKKFFSNIFKI